MKKSFVILCQFVLLILLCSCAGADRYPEIKTTIDQEQIRVEPGLSENEKNPGVQGENTEAAEISDEPVISEGKDEIIASEDMPEDPKKDDPTSDKTPSAPRYENVPEGTQYDFSTLPKQADGCVGEISLAADQLDFEDLQKKLNPSSSVVFRGYVNGLSTQYKRTINNRFYNETPLFVQEVYYGNLKPGDVVDCFEQVFVHLHNGEPVLEHYSCCLPLEENREYIFILHKIRPQHEGGKELYSAGHIYHPYFPVDEWETLKLKTERTWLEQRNYDVLSFYMK